MLGCCLCYHFEPGFNLVKYILQLGEACPVHGKILELASSLRGYLRGVALSFTWAGSETQSPSGLTALGDLQPTQAL